MLDARNLHSKPKTEHFQSIHDKISLRRRTGNIRNAQTWIIHCIIICTCLHTFWSLLRFTKNMIDDFIQQIRLIFLTWLNWQDLNYNTAVSNRFVIWPISALTIGIAITSLRMNVFVDAALTRPQAIDSSVWAATALVAEELFSERKALLLPPYPSQKTRTEAYLEPFCSSNLQQPTRIERFLRLAIVDHFDQRFSIFLSPMYGRHS